jgi:hypothetical protein
MSSEERRSAVLFAAVALLVPLSWLSLGWRPGLLVGANDLSLLLAPAMRRLLEVGGDFGAFLYDPAWVGGSKLRDILGALPLHRLLGALPIDAITLLNASVMFAQALYGFLAARSARAFAALIAPEHEPGLASLALVALVAAFAPLVGFRVGYGHLYILLGALALPAASALILLARAQKLTLTCTLAAVLALTHALPHVGLQPVLYGAIFGLPLLLGCWLGVGAPRSTALRSALPLTLALLAALGLSLPVLAGLVRHFSSGDAPRGFGGAPVTYSYLTATARDWLGSLSLGLDAAHSGRRPFELHETNYALGPALLFLAAFPRRARGLVAGVLASIALLIVFSMNLKPLSTWLLALPPLQMFRIPARAALPLGLALLPLLLAVPLARLPARVGKLDLALLPAAGCLLVVGGLARELVLWLVVLVALGLVMRKQAPIWPSAPALAAVLLVGSLLGFQQRLLPFPSRAELLERPAALAERARAQVPELASPLVRIEKEPDLTPNNSLYTMGLSALSGYNLLNERFLRLYCALLGVPYQPAVSLVSLDPAAPYFAKLAALYDVSARFVRRGSVTTLERVASGGAPLWFSERLEAVASFQELVGRFEPAQLRERALYVASDMKTRSLPALSCESSARDLPYGVGPGPLLVSVELREARRGTCPLTFAMNYVSDMTARGLVHGSWQPLRTFPSHGALLGVLVPEDARVVEVSLEPARPAWALAAAVLGALALFALLARVRRSQPQ